MSHAEKPLRLEVGADGRIKLPPAALEALELEPGEHVTLYIDTRRKSLRIERHVADAWGEALKEKPQKALEDLFHEQRGREAEAERQFDEEMRKPPPKRRPEDDPGHWR
jgi:antitoxin component of MazEF toxin-antitoxin module